MAVILVKNDGMTEWTQFLANYFPIQPFKAHTYSAISGGGPDRDTVIGDLTESAYGGYTAGGVAFTLTPAVNIVGEKAQIVPELVTWAGDGSGTTEDVLGAYITDGMTGELLFIEEFFSPITGMGPVGSAFSFQFVITLGSEFP